MTTTAIPSLQTLQQTSRLDFLFTAGFEMLSQVPSLSRYYMSEFQYSLSEYELTTIKNISRLSCKSCGQIYLPGLNTKVEIKSSKKKKKNVIQTTCLTCSRKSLYNGSYKKKIPKVIATASIATTTPTCIAKKKKNKGKKNNLQALLSKSSSNNNNNSGGGLSDFLTSL